MIPTFLNDFEGFETSVKEATADVMETARTLELDMEPEEVSELLESHDKSLTDEDLLSYG